MVKYLIINPGPRSPAPSTRGSLTLAACTSIRPADSRDGARLGVPVAHHQPAPLVPLVDEAGDVGVNLCPPSSGWPISGFRSYIPPVRRRDLRRSTKTPATKPSGRASAGTRSWCRFYSDCPRRLPTRAGATVASVSPQALSTVRLCHIHSFVPLVPHRRRGGG